MSSSLQCCVVTYEEDWVASFSGSHKQLDSQDKKVITSAIRCAGLNWFVIQSTSCSLYISVLADTGDQRIFIVV